MKRLLIVLTLLLCGSCAQRPILPITEIKFISVSRGEGHSALSVQFSSKIDVLNFFQNATGESQLGETLFCSLDMQVDSEDFDQLTQYLVGDIAELDSAESTLGHIYVSALSAFRREDEGVSNLFMSESELLATLKERNSISCRVFSSAYSFGGHYSSPMLIPAADILRAIQGERG